MAERTSSARRAERVAPVAVEPALDRSVSDESERTLGRWVALGLPLAGGVGALVVGFVAGLGSAILVVSAAMLLGTIALLWASLRTLSGDAPLATDLEALAARRHGVDALAEDKRRVLRALKDLESEHAVGKIDPRDYETLVARYRDEAKSVMREMDLQVAPLRDEAERVARAFLKKRGLAPVGTVTGVVPEEPEAPEEPSPTSGKRRDCVKCRTSNEADATFCKQCGTSMTAAVEGTNAQG